MRKPKAIYLTILFLLMTVAAAFPQQNIREEFIKVIYQNINVVVNGRLINTPVEPFQVAEGYVMLPARAVGEALGCTVEWDAGTNTVYINSNSISITRSNNTVTSHYVEELPVLRNVGPFFQLKSRPITIASRQFSHGLIVELVNPPPGDRKEEDSPAHYAETVIELGGKYTWLEGFLGVDDETRNSRGSYQLQIYGDDRLIFQSETIRPSQYPQQLKLNVDKVHRLSLVVNWEDTGRGDYDRLWAALADLIVY